ncbi:FHA domain-containing protein [[Clostridium] innocuum]|nr:FHA domain-containing protein [[Clostridium] innocuum]
MHSVRISVLQKERIQQFLLTARQQEAVLLYQHNEIKVQAVWQMNGWRFSVSDASSVLYRLHQKAIEPDISSVFFIEKAPVRFHVEECLKAALQFEGYALTRDEIGIGRSAAQDICLCDAGVSMEHALLRKCDQGWELLDHNSTNGCYVNGRRIQSALIQPQDMICLGTLSFIMGNNCVFLPYGKATTKLAACEFEQHTQEEPVISPALYFEQPPYPSLTLEAELPLAKASQENLPAIFVLGPSITMGLSSTAMGIFSFWLAAERKQDLLSVIPTLLMSVSMALGTILWPVLSKRYERKQQRKKEEKRRYVYSCYLLELKQRIQEARKEETAYLRQWYPLTAIQCETYLAGKPHRLYPCDKEGWGHIVLGQGQRQAQIQLQIPPVSSMAQDVLLDKLQALQHMDYQLEEVPVVADISRCYSLCLQAERAISIDWLLNILFQLVVGHTAQELRICIAAERELLSKEKLFCLPHLFVREQRLLAWDVQSARRCGLLIEQLLEDTTVKAVLVFLLEPGLADSMKLESHEKLHILRWSDSLHTAADIRLQVVDNRVNWEKQAASFTLDVCPARLRRRAFLQCCAQLPAQAYAMEEKTLGFLELFHCRSVEELSIASRWRLHDAAGSLSTRIGRTVDGKEICLDAHEHSHGPHGLLAGMTGSGKSECLLTYLLSLAVTYSCEDVSFLLIDFKGGTMANALAALPHTAGIITNLDKGILMRCLCAIEGELNRRQWLLADTGERMHISGMDIDKYMRLRKQDTALAAMPHLFIAVDEFAELKQLFPAVLDHLRQCARIGRSLGIHLLLATQKPFGVVDEQIWSNARFHLCLKVADRNDSMDMLKKEDAVHLQQPGQFLLQVGQDELFLQGQSAWTQAPYDPENRHTSIKQLSYIDQDGILQHTKTTMKVVEHTELEAICDALRGMQVEPAAALWMPPLNKDLRQEALKADKEKLVMGLIDDIAHQQQLPFYLSLKSGRNFALCGMVGSGKAMFVETLLQGCLLHAACMLYLFDFDKPLFKKYAAYEHVAAVFQREDAERIISFLSFMKRMIRQRTRHSDARSVLCILHNYEVFHELYGEYEEELLYVLREGKKYGIIFCITTSALHQLPMRVQACIEDWYLLQCLQQEDYSYIFQHELSCVPLKQPGCGLLKYKEEVCMFQVAVYQEAAWMQASTAPTPPPYCIPLLPTHVAHGIKAKQGSFLGLDSKSKEEIYHRYPKGRALFLLAAYRFCDSFIRLFVKQLMISGNVHIYSRHEFANQKPESLKALLSLLETEQEQFVIWHQLDELDIEADLMKKLLQRTNLHHIFLETMPHLSAYPLWEWYAPIWLEADVLWMGKGFQEHSYALKKNAPLDRILKSNEAYYWEEDACTILQLWEVEENG